MSRLGIVGYVAHAWTVMHTKSLEADPLSYVAGMDDEDHKESRGLAMLHKR